MTSHRTKFHILLILMRFTSEFSSLGRISKDTFLIERPFLTYRFLVFVLHLLSTEPQYLWQSTSYTLLMACCREYIWKVILESQDLCHLYHQRKEFNILQIRTFSNY